MAHGAMIQNGDSKVICVLSYIVVANAFINH